MRYIENLIDKLGYKKSKNLYYISDLDKIKKDFSSHIYRILVKELNPYAIFCIENSQDISNTKIPFILFFDLNSVDDFNSLNIKLWNAQIPVIAFCSEENTIFYNGLYLNDKKLLQFKDETNFSLLNISNEYFWKKNFHKKNKNYKVLNQSLLNNIEYITQKIKDEYKITFATKLILRIIFIRFLIDRNVDLEYKYLSNNESKYEEFYNIIKDRKKLYDLFKYLKYKFNGNLFELEEDENNTNIGDQVFILLERFISGNEEISKNQKSFFPLYDFNIIPTELISNIYEILLGSYNQKKDKAFYTPNYLVAYILNNTVSIFLSNKKECKILDPSCGSGIFLIESYRRIIEKNLPNNGYFDNVEKLEYLFKNNIFGIDINPEAINITIFSIYLIMFDYIEPKSLSNVKLPNIINKNIYIADFFNDDQLNDLFSQNKLKDLKNIDFDFIIGNPPWGKSESKHLEYCKDNNYPCSNNEISRSFIYRSKEYSNKDTICCFVLPSKLFYNQDKNNCLYNSPAKEYRRWILKNTIINNIIELSSVRKMIFKNAISPASIMIYKHNYSNQNVLNNKITYISIKPNLFFDIFNIILIENNDIKKIKQSFLLNDDWKWKAIVYGTIWDINLIDDLAKNYRTIEKIIAEKNIIHGTGVGIKGHNEKSSKHLIGKKYIEPKNNIDHFYLYLDDQILFNYETVHRPREKELFITPAKYCFLKKGINTNNFKMRAVYSCIEDNEGIVFNDDIHAFKMDAFNNDNTLLVLTGLFNSSFYSYMNLLKGSSLGIEREQRFIDEIILFPYPNEDYEQKIAKKVIEIQNCVNNSFFNFREEIQNKTEELDNIIFEAFNLENNEFVKYVIDIQIDMLTKKENINKKVNKTELKKYANYFINYFKPIYSKLDKYIGITFYQNQYFTIFEIIESNIRVDEIKFEQISENDLIKNFFIKISFDKINDLFFSMKNVMNFEPNSFFIVKTNEYKNWHPACAIMDLSNVIDYAMTGDNK